MNKGSKKWLLHLAIFSMAGYLSLSLSSFGVVGTSSDSNYLGQADSQSHFNASPTSREQKAELRLFAEENEVEEDKFAALKMQVEISSSFVNLFCSHIPQYHFHYTRHRLALFKLPFYQPSHRYLTNEVFLI